MPATAIQRGGRVSLPVVQLIGRFDSGLGCSSGRSGFPKVANAYQRH